MFWKKKPPVDAEPSLNTSISSEHPSPPVGAAQYAEASLDTVVGILRALGRYAFDISGVDATAFSRACEEWAEHLAIGAPHPDGEPG